jgi:hypothetical protein
MPESVLPRKISLRRIAHIYTTHIDLDTQVQFLLDFGFSVASKSENEVYFRGYGTEPFLICARKGTENAFGGTAFVVDSLEDLELATKHLPNASEIYDSKAPGGGKCVTFHEPIDQVPFHLVYGQTPVEMTNTFPELEFNFPTHKHRAVGKFQRFKKGPAPTHKLGHFGLCVTDYARAYDFFTSNFNFKPSDIIHDQGKDITSFMHLDRGEELVDHHCFFFYQGPKPHMHHTSYEVHDFDSQLLGHDWLNSKGYENCWGVGRHVLGSQIFDYWFDPSRNIIEHYVDGDLVNDKVETTRTQAGPGNLHVWGMFTSSPLSRKSILLTLVAGPEVPATFLD